MGHISKFEAANDLLSAIFHYRLHPDHADSFRARLRQIGWRKFLLAVERTKADAEPPQDVQEAHAMLELAMYQLVPQRPYWRILRNPQAQSARRQMADMDAAFMERVRDPRQ